MLQYWYKVDRMPVSEKIKKKKNNINQFLIQIVTSPEYGPECESSQSSNGVPCWSYISLWWENSQNTYAYARISVSNILADRLTDTKTDRPTDRARSQKLGVIMLKFKFSLDITSWPLWRILWDWIRQSVVTKTRTLLDVRRVSPEKKKHGLINYNALSRTDRHRQTENNNSYSFLTTCGLDTIWVCLWIAYRVNHKVGSDTIMKHDAKTTSPGTGMILLLNKL